MTILYVGFDLAKNLFAVDGVNELREPGLVPPSVARQAGLMLPPPVLGCVVQFYKLCFFGNRSVWSPPF